MRPSFIALFLAIFATIFSTITFIKELHIEEQMRHLHQHNVNITSILRLDKDIAHLFEIFGMTNNRAERLRRLLQINANATAKRRGQSRLTNSTERERRITKSTYRIFRGNTTSKIPTTNPRKTFNESTTKD